MTENMTPTSAPLDGVEIRALVQNPADEGFAFESSCQSAHADVRRLGPAKGGLSSRVMLATHTNRGAFVGGVYTAADARRIAAALLNAADEIDGKTPLVFVPEGPSATHPIEGDS